MTSPDLAPFDPTSNPPFQIKANERTDTTTSAAEYGIEMRNWFIEAFNEQKACDAIIIVGGAHIGVHKIVLCAHAPFFNMALNGSFKEAEKQTVDLTDDGIEPVRCMLEFLYSAEYNTQRVISEDTAKKIKSHRRNYYDKDKSPISAAEPLSLSVTMWHMGDKYDVMSLRTYAHEKFKADDHGVVRGGSLFDVISAVYETRDNGPSSMRQYMVGEIMDSLNVIKSFKEEYPELLADNPELATDLAMESVAHVCRKCRSRAQERENRVGCWICHEGLERRYRDKESFYAL